MYRAVDAVQAWPLGWKAALAIVSHPCRLEKEPSATVAQMKRRGMAERSAKHDGPAREAPSARDFPIQKVELRHTVVNLRIRSSDRSSGDPRNKNGSGERFGPVRNQEIHGY